MFVKYFAPFMLLFLLLITYGSFKATAPCIILQALLSQATRDYFFPQSAPEAINYIQVTRPDSRGGWVGHGPPNNLPS